MSDDSTTATLTDLFAAVAAHLRGDAADVIAIAESSCASAGFAPLTFAAAMAAGEYLRDVAADRQMPARRLVEILRVAHSILSENDLGAREGDVLAGVARYLDAGGDLWDEATITRMATAPVSTTVAAVRVAAAALTWHARDNGVEPLAAAQTTCLSVARRAAQP